MRPLSQGMIVAGSLAASVATVTNAFIVNKQFYPSIVYLTKSNASLAVLYVQSLVLVYLVFQLLRRIFFGDLRASESEHLSERAWHAVMETCLAFTVFRDDFSPIFVMQFVLLLFVKAFHWLADDRVDLMERSPVITIKFHLRMLSLAAFLGALDSYFVSHAYFVTIARGASAQVVFGFEYAILLTVVLQVVIKYLLHMHDLRSATPWEGKSLYLLHAELFINLIRCVLYMLFMGVMLRVHTLPLFSIRPFYLSLRAFHKALNDVILSRRAVHAMNNRFPVVTADELAAMDATCIICREEMVAASQPKRLPCSHVFHAHCLRSWFQRQQTCPTCRTDILSVRLAPAAAAMRAAVAAAQAGRPADEQQQGAGQAAAAAPQNIFPFLAHQFAFPVPRHPEMQQQQQAAAGQAGGAAPPPPPFANMPPFGQAPPFGFPPIPGLPGFIPPPPPPFPFPTRPATAGLSDEELRAMEGNTRSAVEARIRVLGDIASLLDAAVLQMHQYTYMAPVVTTPAAPAAPTTDASSPAETSATNATSTVATSEEERPGPSTASEEPSTALEQEERRADISEEGSSSRDSPRREQGEEAADMDEMRRRRLEHLGAL